MKAGHRHVQLIQTVHPAVPGRNKAQVIFFVWTGTVQYMTTELR